MSVNINNHRQNVTKPEVKYPAIAESTIELIKSFEGYRNRPYYDSEGWLTTGVGHLIKHNEPHLVSATLSDDQIHDLLKSDLGHCEGAIEKSVKVNLTQNQFDALASLCFNIGPDRFRLSNVVFLLNKGELTAAANAFLQWSRPASLVRRRQQEKALFLADL